MSNLTPGTFTAALLQDMEDKNVIDSLLPKAKFSQATKLKSSPSVAHVKKYVNKDLTKAITLASSPATDPEVLAAFFKDKRLSVRRSLIRNPSTPYATLKELAQWALHTNDDDVSAACARIEPADLLELVVGANMPDASVHLRGLDKVLAKAVEDCSAETILALSRKLDLSNFTLLARAVYSHNNSPVSLTALVRNVDVTLRAPALAGIVSSSEQCTLELAKLLVEFDTGSTFANFDETAARTATYGWPMDQSFVFLADGAPEVLLQSKDPNRVLMAIASGANGPLLDTVIPKGSGGFLRLLVAEGRSNFGKKQERAIVERMIELEKAYTVPTQRTTYAFRLNADIPALLADVMPQLKYRLSSKVFLEVMKVAGYNSVESWLSGDFPANHPRQGEILELLKGDNLDFGLLKRSGLDPKDYVSRSMIRVVNKAIIREWAEEYAEVLGASIFPATLTSKRTAAWLTRRMYNAFGDNVECWNTAIELGVAWQEGADSLIKTSLTLNGVQPVSANPLQGSLDV